MKQYQKLWHLISKSGISKGLLTLAILLILVDAASAVGFPYLTQMLVDNLSAEGLPWELVGLLVGVLLAGSIAQGLSYFLLGRLGQDFVRETRTRIHRRLVHLPVKEFESGRAAEPASRLINDSKVISELVSQQILVFVSGITTLTASLVILWFIDAVLTAVLFGCVIGAFLCILPLAGGLTKLSSQIQAEEAGFIGRLSEVFTQIRLLKSAGAEQQESAIAGKEFFSLYKKGLKEVKVFTLFGPIVNLAVSAAMISILVVGASRVAEGAITLGALVAFILYLFNIVMPLAGLSTFVASLNKSAGAAERLAEIELLETENPEGEALSLAGKSIQIRDLVFSYDDEAVPALNIENLCLPANGITALVGGTGAGKSSLFTLLNRYYECEGIELEGKPISTAALSHWREQIAVVAQNTPVLSGTVRFNLCYGRHEPLSDEQLIEALERAQLWPHFKEQQGLNTEIGEHGNNLSGGQKQRLAIARAILREPNLLILDEATSALDSKTEQAVSDALKPLMENRTSIIAAHRLSTVVDADQIVVLEKGRVLDVGKHEELLARCEHYRQLVEQQLQLGNGAEDIELPALA